MRKQLETSYQVARQALADFSGNDWQQLKQTYPPAAELSDEALVLKLAGLTQLVVNATRAKIQEKNVDRTTGLGTKDFFREKIAAVKMEEIADDSFVAVYLDVNELKKVNDENGHQAGDKYLETLGRAIQSQIRADDQAYRVGGDEFVLILKCDVERAKTVADRTLEKFRELWNKRYNVLGGFSYGVASAGEEEVKKVLAQKTPAEFVRYLVETADSRQYEHKRKIKSERAANAQNAPRNEGSPFAAFSDIRDNIDTHDDIRFSHTSTTRRSKWKHVVESSKIKKPDTQKEEKE
jgi:diguanylate cyclase (GGDEF)-like protein